MIKAPFNFVPLSDKVYFPDWADQISHDIPFEDGLSGTFELEITAETPIFVRNGHKKIDAEEQNETYNSFNHIRDEHFIPSTSIKGEIRSIMQIMSFGKISLDKNAMFVQRDWENKALYPIKEQRIQNDLHCGYLVEKEDGCEIIDCGIPMRIAHTRIDEFLETPLMANHFSKNCSFDITKEYKYKDKLYDPKSAVFKYALAEGKKLSELRFTIDELHAVEYKENRVRVSADGEFEGSIVFTGQPDKWMYPRPTKMTPDAGKFYEFVFLKPEHNAQKYQISEKEYKHYKFVYSDSPDWKYLRKEYSKIPVFFRLERGNIKDWGLAFLYKLPYDKSPYDTLSENHKSEMHDLAECIFGYVENNSRGESNKNQNSLKGRVQFSHAFTHNASECEDVYLSLGSPKASYYPIYIRQNGNKGIVTEYDTYNNGTISGWKRYWVRTKAFAKCTGNRNIDTIIKPLAKGSVFSGKVMFHNLRRIELGALLSAISFHNTDGCFHQLGQGKPYGFGKVNISIKRYPSELPPIDDLLAEYEEVMHNFLKGSWVGSEQMKSLITLASSEVATNDTFDYMQMSNTRTENEFMVAKERKEYLEDCQTLCKHTYMATSLYEKLRLERIRRQEEENEKLEQERLEKLEQAAQEAQQRIEEERKQQYLVPLSEKITNINKLPTLFGNVKQWMKQNACSSLSEEDMNILKDKIFSIYSTFKQKEQTEWKQKEQKWKELSALVGDETVKNWIKEL